MPTPFYHLSLAEQILAHPSLSTPLRSLLLEQRGAFLFGNTAPDVQVISGQAREETHFFTLPLRPVDGLPWELLLGRYPQLANFSRLPAAQIAFLTGYICHLQADWSWIKHIYAPLFGPTASWENYSRRSYVHNVLRAYLDFQVVSALPAGISAWMAGTRPLSWLPFVRDTELERWNGFVSSQLIPGAQLQTVEVFAARQGLSPALFYALLESEERMQAEVFSRIPLAALEAFREDLIQMNLQWMMAFIG